MLEIIDIQKELIDQCKPSSVSDVISYIKEKCLNCCKPNCKGCEYNAVRNNFLKPRTFEGWVYRNLKNFGNCYVSSHNLREENLSDLKRHGFAQISYKETKQKSGIVIYANYKGVENV